MSDFLARLTARHLGEPAVRPRAVSRFEATTASLPDPDTFDIPTAPIEHAGLKLRTDALAPDARLATHPRPAPPTRTVGVDDPTEAFIANRPESEPRRSDHARLPSPPLAARANMDTRPAPVVESRADDDRQRHAAAIVPRTHSPVVREVPTIVTRVAERAAVTPNAVRVADRAEPTATSPDVVRVHIGRVEVRAVLSPSEKARPRANKSSDAPGPLSLDRYLAGQGRP